jgi:predicted RNase H-like nuclease
MVENPPYVGVDWSSGAWLAVGLTGAGDVHASTHECIKDLWEKYGDDEVTVVADVPIGLFEEDDRDDEEELVRECDRLARKVIGSRYRSVFNPPAREVAQKAREGESYEEVKELHEKITGKGLTQQAYAVASGIAEVDTLVSNGIDGELLEGHPEVSFAALDGDLSYSKKTAAGVHERVEALEVVDDDAIEMVQEICKQVSEEPHEVGFDDVLDALVLAYTAGYASLEERSLPKCPPENQQSMRIIYRAAEPFRTI